jgi:hypothetical protein
MGRRDLTNRPRGRLAHHVGSSYSFWTSTITHSYMTWEVPIDRPAGGAATGEVTCGTCGRPVAFTLHSGAWTRARRRLWLALCLGSLVVVAVGIAVLSRFGDEPVDAIPLSVQVGELVALIGGALSAIIWFSVWWAEEGLRGPGVFIFPRRGHTVRR